MAQTYYLTLLRIRSVNTSCLDWDFCFDRNEGVGGTAFFFGSSEDKPVSKLIQEFAWIHFHAVAGLRQLNLFPCWQSTRGWVLPRGFFLVCACRVPVSLPPRYVESLSSFNSLRSCFLSHLPASRQKLCAFKDSCN